MSSQITPSAEELDRFVVSPPEMIGLEVTQRCNLQCPMCSIHAEIPHSHYAHADMRLEIVDRLAPVMKSAREVMLTGGGEPFLLADLPAFIDRCQFYNPDIQVRLISNGVLLTERKARMLIEKRVHRIDFSMDGTIQYGHVGGGGDFDKVKENLRRLARLKTEYDSALPEIWLAFVAMRDNLCELPGIIEFAAEIKAGVYFQPISPSSEAQRNQNVFRHVDYTRHMLEVCQARAGELSVEFQPVNVAPDLSQAPHGSCPMPSTQLWVSHLGALHACCGGISTGHTLDEADLSLEAVWNGPFMRRLRWELDSGNYNSTCGRCPVVWNTIENQERGIPAPASAAPITLSSPEQEQRIRQLEGQVKGLEEHIAAINRGRVMRALRVANRLLGRN